MSNTHYYAGEQQDPTGLYYDRARYYNPTTGRFIGEDSVGGNGAMPASMNRYTYVGNSPVTYTDPSGHFFNLALAAGGALVGAVIGGVVSYANQALTTGNLNPFNGTVLTGIGIGAATGFVGGVTFGLGLAFGTSIAGAVGIEAGTTSASVLGASTIAASAIASDQVAHITGNILSGRSWNDNLLNPQDLAFSVLSAGVLHKFFFGDFGSVALKPKAQIIELPDSVKPSELRGLNETGVRERLSSVGAVEDEAKYGGDPRWTWEEGGNTYQVRYHRTANLNFPDGPTADCIIIEPVVGSRSGRTRLLRRGQ